jgi:hypothetical protein
LAVYDIDRDSQGQPIGLRVAFGAGGLLNGKNGPAFCWAGFTLLFQAKDGLNVLSATLAVIPLKLGDILAFGGQCGQKAYAVLSGGRHGVYEICSDRLEETLKMDYPILSFACSDNQMALSLWDNSIMVYEGSSLLWRADLKKPAREVCFLEGMLLLRGMDNALTLYGKDVPMVSLGPTPPAAGRYPKLSFYKSSVVFSSIHGMCRAELRKEDTGVFKISVFSGGEPRMLVKEAEGGYIIDPYRPGGISLYDRDCREYIGNDIGELCSANSWSIVQYCPSPLPPEIPANPELGVRPLFSRAAAIECAAPCSSGGFYLFSSDGRVFHSGVFKDNMLSEISRPDNDFMPRKAAASQNRILLVGNSRSSGELRFLQLTANCMDIARVCAGGLANTLSAADYHIAGDGAGGFFLSHGNEIYSLSRDDTGLHSFTHLACGTCLEIACCGQYILCRAGKGICILDSHAAASVLTFADTVSKVAVWGGDMIMEVNNREAYVVSL